MKFGEKVRKIRKEKGMTQDELAKRVGFESRSSIAKIESGDRDTTQTMIFKLANALGVTASYLMDEGDGGVIDFLPKEKIHQIPIFATVSAGFGAYASSDIVGYIPLYIDNPYDVSDTICIKVTGDSMYPKIEEGDLIVVHRQPTVDNGQIAVILVDSEEGLVKQFFQDTPDEVRLHSLNPEYKDKIFKKEELNSLRIVGLVRQVVKAC